MFLNEKICSTASPSRNVPFKNISLTNFKGKYDGHTKRSRYLRILTTLYHDGMLINKTLLSTVTCYASPRAVSLTFTFTVTSLSVSVKVKVVVTRYQNCHSANKVLSVLQFSNFFILTFIKSFHQNSLQDFS